jgi:hypothetical protein
MLQNIYNIIINQKNLENSLENYQLIMEYLSYMHFNLMNLQDLYEFIYDFDIEDIKQIIFIFNKY